jgi:predicted AlkP superfamily pyrophosphatase or phosphodiesterase
MYHRIVDCCFKKLGAIEDSPRSAIVKPYSKKLVVVSLPGNNSLVLFGHFSQSRSIMDLNKDLHFYYYISIEALQPIM